MKSDKITKENGLQSKEETALNIKLTLCRDRITVEQIAHAMLMTTASVRNLLNGSSTNAKGRQRITNFVGKILWPGVVPAPQNPELELIHSMLPMAADLVRQVKPGKGAETNERNQQIATELDALASPAIRAAIVSLGARLPLSTISLIATIFPQPLSDRLLGIKRDPKKPNRIVLGAAAQS